MKYENKLFIDSKDAMVEYGVFVERNGFRQTLQMPVFKKPDTTEWPEYDGIEVDLSNPLLEARQFQIQFCIKNVRWAEDLFIALSDGCYHTFTFAEIEKTMTLRLVSNGSFSSYIRLGKLTLTFSDDSPTRPAQPVIKAGDPTPPPYALGASEVVQRGYKIDNLDLSRFGVYVLKGTDDTIRKAPNIREHLKITAKNINGVKYDSGGDVHWKSKDITLKLFMSVPSMKVFWQRYNALYYQLMGNGLRTFYFSPVDEEFHCYYKSNSVTRFERFASGRVWCEFSVVLTVTDWHPVSSWLLLETEGEELVITEGNINYNIRIRI